MVNGGNLVEMGLDHLDGADFLAAEGVGEFSGAGPGEVVHRCDLRLVPGSGAGVCRAAGEGGRPPARVGQSSSRIRGTEKRWDSASGAPERACSAVKPGTTSSGRVTLVNGIG